MSFNFYNVIHLLGLFGVLLALGGISFHAASGGSKTDPSSPSKIAGMLHGIGLFLVLLGGFGMLAKLGASVVAGWVMVKLFIWIIIGGLIAVPYRKPEHATKIVFLIIVLAITSAYMAIYKPF